MSKEKLTTKKKRSARRCRRYLSVAVLLCVFLCLGGCGVRQKTIIFSEHLEDTVLTLDGQSYPLRELAFYVAYEEQLVQQQALLYDADNTNSYWNTHVNGHFVRVRARQLAMDMAIHDFIFYELALELGMELSEEESAYALSRSEDFWMDLGAYGQQQLGITAEELDEDLLRMALAQKCQELYAAMEDVSMEDCDVSGAAYEKLLAEHSYKIKKSVWGGISMGHVTLE